MGKVRGSGKDNYVFENRTDKVLIIKNMALNGIIRKPGKPGSTLFMEDIVALPLILNKGEQCWARQWNPESPRAVMSEIDGGMFWLLSIKTEGRTTHVAAKNGARVEVIGGISYQSWDGPIDPPMFVVENADFSAVIAIHGRTHPFSKIVSETLGGETRELTAKEPGNPLRHHLPLYRSGH